jgi:hypothetical protein
MITLASLNFVGQYCSLKFALYSCRRVLWPLGCSSWIIWAVIWSGPGALFGDSVLITRCKSEALSGRVLTRLFVRLASMLSTSGWG